MLSGICSVDAGPPNVRIHMPIYLYQEVQKTPIGNGWGFFYRPRPDVIDSGANDSELVLHDVAGHSHYLCMVFIVQWGC